jgi:hypothetical protein
MKYEMVLDMDVIVVAYGDECAMATMSGLWKKQLGVNPFI